MKYSQTGCATHFACLVLCVAGCGGAPSNPSSDVATQAPIITSISPTQFVVGSGDSIIDVYGSNFSGTNVVQWNGGTFLYTSLNSYSIGTTQYTYLSAAVPASLLTNTGTVIIKVNNQGNIPGVSNAITLSIVNPPVPTPTAVAPRGAPLNTATTITVTGNGFVNQSTVQMDSTVLSSNYVSPTSLTAQVPASMLTLPG